MGATLATFSPNTEDFRCFLYHTRKLIYCQDEIAIRKKVAFFAGIRLKYTKGHLNQFIKS